MDFKQETIAHALSTLHSQGILLYPSDTLWGLGCDARSTIAVKKIYQLKAREDAKALICLVANRSMAEDYLGPLDPRLDPFLEQARPTTVIYPKVKGISSALVAPDGSIGIRIVKDAFCRNLILALGAPLVSTSANLSGQASPLSFQQISAEILAGVNHIVPLKKNKILQQPSRIIRLLSTGEIEVLRE
jgi:L-threonylcarbamoyladenylate synthase